MFKEIRGRPLISIPSANIHKHNQNSGHKGQKMDAVELSIWRNHKLSLLPEARCIVLYENVGTMVENELCSSLLTLGIDRASTTLLSLNRSLHSVPPILRQ